MEENQELKGFLKIINHKIKRKNIIITISSVLLTLCLIFSVSFLYRNIKFPIPLDTVFVEWVAEDEITVENEVEILDSISFEITNIGKQYISSSDVIEEGDRIIIKLKGNLGNTSANSLAFSRLSVKDKKEVYLEGKDERDRILVWKKGMEIMSKEEWSKWYYDIFVLKNPLIRFEKSKQK